MKHLTQLSRDALISNIKNLVAREKQLELELLDCLREIDRRLLHNEMGYGSLYEFATQFLGLSEASAFRRIAAMRIVREIPEVKASLESGAHALPQATTAEVIKRALEETLAKTRKMREQAVSKTPPAESRAAVRRRVFSRAQNRCEFVAPDGKRCTATHGLELDHRIPRAHGGGDGLENLRAY